MSKYVVKALFDLGLTYSQIKRSIWNFKSFEILHAKRKSTNACAVNQRDLEKMTEGLYSKLTNSYFAHQLHIKGYTKKQIAYMLSMSYDNVKSMLRAVEKKQTRASEKQTRLELSKQYRLNKRKKVDIEMIIVALKHGWVKGLRELKLYVNINSVKNTLKRFGLTKEQILSEELDDIKRWVVNKFVLEKTGLTLTSLVSELKKGKMTAIGIKEWDRLRNTSLSKKLIRQNSDNLEEFLINHIWNYLKYYQTVVSMSRRNKLRGSLGEVFFEEF